MGVDVIAISGKRVAAGLTWRRLAVGGINNALTEVIEVRTFGGQDGGLYVECTIEGKPCRMLVDTGASVSVVKKSIERWVDKFEQQRGITQLQTATGDVTPIYVCSEVTVKIGDFKNCQQVCVADIIADCVLGLDFMNAFNC